MDITRIIRIVSLSYGKAPYGLIMPNVNPNDADELRVNMLDILRKVESEEYIHRDSITFEDYEQAMWKEYEESEREIERIGDN